MQEELLQFKLQEVWTLVDLPYGKRVIGTKWVLRNKNDERGIVLRNKARLVAQGHTQEQGIDYDEVFTSVARIEAIRLFLAYASFKDFVVYHMDVKSSFFYKKIKEEVYVCQPPGFKDPDFPNKVGKIDKTLFIRRHKDDILLVQVYADDIIFSSTKKELCNAFEKMMHEKFQMMCACARYQVNPKVSHIHVVKRIFRYLKGQPKFGLWYLKDYPFDLVAYTDSDYAGASLDIKSTIEGCQFLRCRLISWQCKKQTVAANSTIEAKYPTKSEGFEQIVDFLNANPIKYALTVNLTVYTSCIEQFWATVKAKTVNGEGQLQALVDGKKVLITESTIRRDLQLEDGEGVDCLPNAVIFEHLTLIGYEKISQKLTFYKALFSQQWKFLIHTISQCISAKTTTWNEFSSTMASVIICLSTNQKFNFSKYIFESMVKNLDNMNKFFMYPRFVQVFLNNQLEGMSNHNMIYVIPSHTKNIFGNMKRVGKGFFKRDLPVFPTMMVQAQKDMGKGSDNPTDPHHIPTIIQSSTSQPQNTKQHRKPRRKVTEVPQPIDYTSVADEAVNEEMDDSLERAAITATSLDAEQDRGNIFKTQSKATPNEPCSQGTSLGGGPKCQETIRDTVAQTMSERASKISNDLLLAGVNTPQSGEDSLKLNELMELCTTYNKGFLIWRLKKTTQAMKIESLKRRVNKLERRKRSRTHGLKRLYKVRLSARVESSKDEGLGGEEVFVVQQDEKVVEKEAYTAQVQVTTAATTPTISIDEATLAQVIAELKHAKPKAKAKGIVFHKPEESTTTTTATIPKPKSQDKGKAKMIKEPVKLKKKDQIQLDEEVALKLQAEFEKEQRLEGERAQQEEKANIALIESWDDKTRKFFAAKRAEEKRNKPLTQAQQRKIMCTYLKNIEGKKLTDLKNKSFDSIQKMFDIALTRVNTFVDYKTELVEESSKKAKMTEGSSKRAREELEEENAKKQKIDDDKDTAELKQSVKIIPDEEGVAIDVIPLAVKPPSIVDWKI
nr:copia protein [Tanacetum cinerariifolium]